MRSLAEENRTAILGFIGNEAFWGPGVLGLPDTALAQIAESIIAICTQWRWI